MKRIRYLVVAVLELSCAALDYVPWYDHGWYWRGLVGCRLGLANWSSDLEDRWHTGYWKDAGT